MNYSNQIIEKVLADNKIYLNKDYKKYRNHVYRVFILCQKMDSNEENIEKYAIASVFHDIGIWTNKTFDYLDPSIKNAQEYLKTIDKLKWKDEISVMIDMHHKKSKYKGQYEKTVENFRRADWIDLTMGMLNFNLTKSEIKETTKVFPNLGFHRFLLVQTLKNFFKHPLNPLPMFKK